MALNDTGKIMSKSFARGDEQCCVCRREVPDSKMVIRHRPTSNIICLICLVGLAEVE